MECKSGGISIERKRTSKKIERMGMKRTRIEYIRMQHIMIRSKVTGKQMKPKRLYRWIKHIGKGTIIV